MAVYVMRMWRNTNEIVIIGPMNRAHMEFCTSDVWREMLEEQILPPILDGRDLGTDVVEIGPGPGFTTAVLRARGAHVTAVELDPALAAQLEARHQGAVDVVCRDARDTGLPSDRFSGAASFNMLHHVPEAAMQDAIFAELARILRPGGLLVAVDAVYSEATAGFHEDDVYNPIDPATLKARLDAAGFGDIEVDTFEFGWKCAARAQAARA
jgi:SAM-dependent methyltransferase